MYANAPKYEEVSCALMFQNFFLNEEKFTRSVRVSISQTV